MSAMFGLASGSLSISPSSSWSYAKSVRHDVHWLGSHISDPHFHMRTRGAHAYHAFPAARATRTPSPASLRAFAPCLAPGPGATILLLHVHQTMVAATHGCPQATPDGPLHPVKRHDVPSVHPLAGRQPVMSRWPIRIRREHFAESIVGRYGLYEPSDSPDPPRTSSPPTPAPTP